MFSRAASALQNYRSSLAYLPLVVASGPASRLGLYYLPRLLSSSSSSSPGNGSARGRDGANMGKGHSEQSSEGHTNRSTDSKSDPADDFGLDDFLVHEEEEQLTTSTESIQKKLENTPESQLDQALALEMVDRMVAATKSTLESPASRDILSSITPHTISVLRASRIITHSVQAAGTDVFKYPIEKRVKAQLWVDQLDLSPPAREALLLLAGPRVKEEGAWIKLSYDRFPTMEENRAYIVTLLDKLVAAAKTAVGDQVDQTPLSDWSDVVEAARQQTQEEINQAGTIERVLGLSN